MRLAAQAKGGFYPTPPRVVDMIAELVYPSGARYRSRDAVRALDPCCGAGEALAQLAERLRERWGVPVETYGVELRRERAQEASEWLDHVLAADLFQTSIANGAFGLLYLNPPYDYDSDGQKRVEHAFLTHCTRYLAEDALLVFIVPRQRLTVSARYLASYYRELRCWAFPSPEREAFDQVVVLGARKAEPNLDPAAEAQVREWAAGEPEELETRRHPLFDVPASAAGEVLFATRTVDPVAAAAEARRSGLWASAGVTDSLWPTQAPKTRPLMPLRRGHMAMLVAAGFLDNLCLEADGSRLRRSPRRGRVTGPVLPSEAGPACCREASIRPKEERRRPHGTERRQLPRLRRAGLHTGRGRRGRRADRHRPVVRAGLRFLLLRGGRPLRVEQRRRQGRGRSPPPLPRLRRAGGGRPMRPAVLTEERAARKRNHWTGTEGEAVRPSPETINRRTP